MRVGQDYGGFRGSPSARVHPSGNPIQLQQNSAHEPQAVDVVRDMFGMRPRDQPSVTSEAREVISRKFLPSSFDVSHSVLCIITKALRNYKWTREDQINHMLGYEVPSCEFFDHKALTFYSECDRFPPTCLSSSNPSIKFSFGWGWL